MNTSRESPCIQSGLSCRCIFAKQKNNVPWRWWGRIETCRSANLLTPYSLHAAQSFLRSQPFFSYSRNSSHFMEPEDLLPHPQVPATWPYPEPVRSIPYTPHPTSWRSILYYSPINAWVSQVAPFPQVSPPNPAYDSFPPPYALHAPPISFSCNSTYDIWNIC